MQKEASHYIVIRSASHQFDDRVELAFKMAHKNKIQREEMNHNLTS